jgi:P2-related tail formation protein
MVIVLLLAMLGGFLLPWLAIVWTVQEWRDHR